MTALDVSDAAAVEPSPTGKSLRVRRPLRGLFRPDGGGRQAGGTGPRQCRRRAEPAGCHAEARPAADGLLLVGERLGPTHEKSDGTLIRRRALSTAHQDRLRAHPQGVQDRARGRQRQPALPHVYGPRRGTACAIKTMVLDAIAGRTTRLGPSGDVPTSTHADDAALALVRRSTRPRFRPALHGDRWRVPADGGGRRHRGTWCRGAGRDRAGDGVHLRGAAGVRRHPHSPRHRFRQLVRLRDGIRSTWETLAREAGHSSPDPASAETPTCPSPSIRRPAPALAGAGRALAKRACASAGRCRRRDSGRSIPPSRLCVRGR